MLYVARSCSRISWYADSGRSLFEIAQIASMTAVVFPV
jgi:hypothetical protein